MFGKKIKKLKDTVVGIGGDNEYIRGAEGVMSTKYSSIIDRYNIELDELEHETYVDVYARFDEKADQVVAVHGGTNTKAKNSPYSTALFKGDVQQRMSNAVTSNRRTCALIKYIEGSKQRAQASEIIRGYLDAIQKKQTFSSDALFQGLMESNIVLPSAPIVENLARLRDVTLGFINLDSDRDELLMAGKLLERAILPLLKILYSANIATIQAQEPVLDEVLQVEQSRLAKIAEKKSRKRGAL